MSRIMMSFIFQSWLAIAMCFIFFVSKVESSHNKSVSPSTMSNSEDPSNGDVNNDYVHNQVIARLKDSAYIIPHGMKMKKMKRFAHCNKNKNENRKKKNRNKKKCQTELLEFDLMTLEITNPQMTVGSAIQALSETGDYEYVEPDYLMQESAIPNDPLFSQQWGLNSTHETDPDVNAPVAWDITTGDSDVVVAIIDGGVDYTHPDLTENMWTNAGEIPGDGIDNDLNGIVDDYYGFDAHNDDGDPMDDRGHGTHLAGIIGAVSNNGIGVAGVSWNTSIMAVKFLDENGSGSISDAIEAINYVIDMHDRGVNIRITNNSWGGRTFSQALSDAIGALADKDILFVASSGNDVKDLEIFPYYPASYQEPNIMVVGMHGNVNNLVVASNIGESIVDISAPGENILSTALVTGASVCKDADSDGYSECTGTSMSAAYASGVAALLQAQYPVDSSRSLINRVVRSSKPSVVSTLYAIPWTGKSVTGEIVDAEGALAYDGMVAWPRKFFIEMERPFVLDQPIEIAQTINLSSLSDGSRTWSLSSAESWVAVSQPGGTVVADQDTEVNLSFESEFDFGLTKGRITINDLSEPNADFDVPVTIRTRLQTLDLVEKTLDSPRVQDEMGYAVDIDGDVAVVSAPGEAVNAAYGGSVYVFRQQGDKSWLLEATLTASDAVAGNRFGHDVAISGTKIVVGAGSSDSIANAAGAAYVFKYETGQWLEEQKLIPSGTNIESDLFGQAVAIEGDIVVIGAPEVGISYRPGAADRRGSAYVFYYDGAQWIEQQKFLEPDPDLDQYIRFGASVDVQASRIAIGAHFHPDDSNTAISTSGRVYTYVLVAGSWQLEHTFAAPESYVELFGYKVVLNDDELAISAPNASNDLRVKVGSIFTYNFSQSGWAFSQRISPPDIEKNDVAFGIGLDVDAKRMVIGVPGDEVKAINSGSAYVFNRVNEQWIPDGRLLPESVYSFSQLNYGRDTAVSGNVTLIGSGLKTASNIPTTGYLYEFPISVHYLETLTVQSVSTDSVSLTWDPSTDNQDLAFYEILRDGQFAGTAATNSYTDTGLNSQTTYMYQFQAVDTSGNRSATSNSVFATTDSGCSVTGASSLVLGDNKLQWLLTNESLLSVTTSQIDISWPSAQGSIKKIHLGGDEIYRQVLPPPNASINSGWRGDSSKRRIDVGASDELKIEFATKYENDVEDDYTIQVTFAEGCSVLWAVAPDTQSPTVPTNLSQTGNTMDSVTLAWNSSSDNVGVTGYEIFRDGNLLDTATATSYTDIGLTANSSYDYEVVAFDAAGNRSGPSGTLTATTAAIDLEEPSAPTSLQVVNVDNNSVDLTWNASTDNQFVAGYRIYRDGQLEGDTASTSYTSLSLTPATTYQYYVIAYDAPGNESNPSNSVNATTDAGGCSVTGASTLILGDNKIEWDIANIGAETITIASIEIAWPTEQGNLKRIKLDGDEIYRIQESPPSTVIDDNWRGDVNKREINSGDTRRLKVEFTRKYKNDTQSDYALTVEFIEGCSVSF